MMSKLRLRIVAERDLDRCFTIEQVAYAGDEAASKEKILKRIRQYPEGFVVLENDREMIGFINCGATDRVEMADDEFKSLVGHNPKGKKIVIMSVVVHPDYQRQGMAGRLMVHFIAAMRALGKTELNLMCQTELIALYARHGFVYLAESASDHGGLSWHEMRLTL
ncbi:GNAT family N-acetyltransferase [Reinekea sp.]|uniref:GNAT family N-acetyltransferase n=1 Tax=Reinekea sp. TaxID=1970455 RepID=UPI002A80F9B0|nr:GNAT family N-acetyltransferase [Reinekea sp.]